MLAFLRVAHADWDVQPAAKVDTTVRRDKASVPKADARQADAGGFKEVGLRVVYVKGGDRDGGDAHGSGRRAASRHLSREGVAARQHRVRRESRVSHRARQMQDSALSYSS
jgi:hypothetical protein